MAMKRDEAAGLKFTATRAELLPHLAACAEVTDAKPPMPALACVLVESTAAGLRFSATNIPQTVTRDLAVKAARVGQVLVNAKDFSAVVAAMGPGEVQVTETPARLKVEQGARRYTLPVFDLAEAPTRTHVDPSGVEIGAAALVSILSRLAPNMSTDSTRETLFGARVIVGAGKLRGMTTNGHLGAIASVPCEAEGAFDAAIPAPAVKHLIKILDGVDGVRLARVGNLIHAFFDGGSYSTAIITDRYAPVESAIPRAEGSYLRADRKTMLAAVKSVATVAGSDGFLTLQPSASGVTFGAESDKGGGEEEVPATSSLRSSRWNAPYFRQALEFLAGSEVDAWCKPGDRVVDGCPDAMLFRSPGDTENVFALMPVRYTQADLDADPG